MGCDIHPAVEVRRKGVWRYHRPQEPCRWYDEVWTADEIKRVNDYHVTQADGYHLDAQPGDRKNTWDRCKTALPEFFKDRNYAMFAILADVRNDGHVQDPIAPDRGFPSDITKESLAKMSHEHSPTWVGLDELIDYDLTAPLTLHGMVSERQYIESFIKRKDPESWSGGIFGNDIVSVTPEQWLNLWPEEGPYGALSAPETQRDPTKRYFIHYEWQVPRIHHVPQLQEWVDYLTPIIPKGGTAEDVRVVMDFDS